MIITVNSFRRGTGKTSIVANVAALLAMQGHRVGMIDTAIQSPSLHMRFGLGAEQLRWSLNDYIWGRCDIEETALDLGPHMPVPPTGQLVLVPASADPAEIARVLREGYALALLNDALRRLADSLGLDVLLVDTPAGISEETLLASALADVLALVVRPDQQDYQGTGVTLGVARSLEVPRVVIALNHVLPSLDSAALSTQISTAFGCPVAGVLPHTDAMAALGSAAVFALAYPAHPLTAAYARLARAIVDG